MVQSRAQRPREGEPPRGSASYSNAKTQIWSKVTFEERDRIEEFARRTGKSLSEFVAESVRAAMAGGWVAYQKVMLAELEKMTGRGGTGLDTDLLTLAEQIQNLSSAHREAVRAMVSGLLTAPR